MSKFGGILVILSYKIYFIGLNIIRTAEKKKQRKSPKILRWALIAHGGRNHLLFVEADNTFRSVGLYLPEEGT
jgi:hypothetical protein